MALTTYRLRDVVQNAEGHWLHVGCERVATGCVPLAPDGSVLDLNDIPFPYLYSCIRRHATLCRRSVDA